MALLLMPIKRLMHDKETYAVLGTLNMKDMGYIMGVTDHLREKREIRNASAQHNRGHNLQKGKPVMGCVC